MNNELTIIKELMVEMGIDKQVRIEIIDDYIYCHLNDDLDHTIFYTQGCIGCLRHLNSEYFKQYPEFSEENITDFKKTFRESIERVVKKELAFFQGCDDILRNFDPEMHKVDPFNIRSVIEVSHLQKSIK